MKLIICQIRHELSVTIHEISTSWKKPFDGGSYIRRTQVQLCYSRFKEDREDVNAIDDARLGRTSTTNENIEAVRKMILDNCPITIREVADDVGISFGSCQAIFYGCFRDGRCGSEDCSKIAKFWAITMLHGHSSGDVDDPDLLKKVITSDEWWVYGYDIETKAQSS